MHSEFLAQYKEKMTSTIHRFFPEADEAFIETVVKKEMKSRLKNPRVEFEGEQTSLLSVLQYQLDNEAIITGYGTLFVNREKEISTMALMCDEFISKRSVHKDKMFSHMNDEDKTQYNNQKTIQINYKVLNNSFYGASIESNSIFYHPYVGKSITYTGEDIITFAVITFERFLSNNIDFRTFNDLMVFVDNILSEDYQTVDSIEFRQDASVDEVYEYLESKYVGEDKDLLFIFKERLLNHLDQDDLNKLYFKNNLFEFIERTNVIDLYSHVIGHDDFLDPNHVPERLVGHLDEIWKYIKEWVSYNYSDFYRFDRCDKGLRKSVLTIDTDSNFLYLKPYFDFFEKYFPDRVDIERDESIISTINTATYHITKLINDAFFKFGELYNVPEDIRHRINMKNEFLIKRIMMTRNKKNYAGIVLMQEGNLMDPPELDVKGLAIRKVSTNAHIRESFTELLEHDILGSKEIDLGNIIGKFRALESKVRQSLLSGSCEFSLPGKVNSIHSYVNPYQMMSLRGAITWNSLFPDKEIDLPNKVNMFKLNIDSLEMLEDMSDEHYAKIEKLFENKDLVKNGLNVISLPKNQEELPDWIIPYIDIDTMVADNIKSGIIMLESLGFKTLDILKHQLPTNIIEI